MSGSYRPRRVRFRFPIVMLAIIIATASATGHAQSPVSAPTGESSLAPIAGTAASYGALYLIVVASVQVAGGIVTATAPASWGAAAQIFGVPLLVVPLMAELVPLIRRTVPPLIDGWIDGVAGGTENPDTASASPNGTN